MRRHFVTFYSPGTFVAETTVRPIDAWDVEAAKQMAGEIVERYNAKPYAFQFSTRNRTDDDLDSKVVAKSQTYYLKGKIETLAEIVARNDPQESTLRMNMRNNGIERVVVCHTPYKWTQPLRDGDVVLEQAGN